MAFFSNETNYTKTKKRQNVNENNHTNPILVKQMKKKKRGKFKKITLFTFLFIIIGVVAIGFYLTNLLNGMKREKINKNNLGAVPSISSKVKNIALFGVDSKNGGGRSDTILVMSLDYKNNKIKMTSIMRDSYVKIKGFGSDKITHAYKFGGPELAIRTLNENFKLDITDFVTVKFDQMARIVDAVNGVEITVKPEELAHLNTVIKDTAKEMNEKPQYLKKAGKQILNGQQAVSYSRIRKIGNYDYQRTERQREVLMALFKRTRESSVFSYPTMVKKLMPHLTTSLENGEILRAGTLFIKNAKMVNARIPSDKNLKEEDAAAGRYIDGTWYLAYDLKTATKTLHSFIYDDILPDPPKAKVEN